MKTAIAILAVHMFAATTAAVPKVVIRPDVGGMEIGWTSVSGLTYRVEYSTNLLSGHWSSLQETGTPGGPFTATDTNLHDSSRFYQVLPVVPQAVKNGVSQTVLADGAVPQRFADGTRLSDAATDMAFPLHAQQVDQLPPGGALIRAPGGQAYSHLFRVSQSVRLSDFIASENTAARGIRLEEIATNLPSIAVKGTQGKRISVSVAGPVEECERWASFLDQDLDCPPEGTVITNQIPVGGYFYEADQAGFGIWLIQPEKFFSSGRDPWRDTLRQVFHYGLETLVTNLPAVGVKTYAGVASGIYLGDNGLGADGSKNFAVAGDLRLTVDFAAQTVTGSVALCALNRQDLSPASGRVQVVFSNGHINAAGLARFSGNTEVVAADGVLRSAHFIVLPFNQSEHLRPIGYDDGLGRSTGGRFDGMFAGSGAEEVTGKVRFGLSRGRALDFGFIARAQD